MKFNATNTLLLFNLLGLFAVIGLLSSLYVKEPVEVTTEQVSHNLSCPQPNVSHTLEPHVEPNVTVETPFENIQNPDMEPDYRLVGGTLQIKDVDSVGELYGSSMSPSIMNEDLVILQRFDGRDIQEGMRVRYDIGGAFEIHTVVGDYQRQGYVYTKGDRVKGTYRKRVPVENITHFSKGVLYG